MTLTTSQIIAKAARIADDDKAYDSHTEAQRAAINEIVLSTGLTDERAAALWAIVEPEPNPCHMVPADDQSDDIGETIAEDAAERERRHPAKRPIRQTLDEMERNDPTVFMNPGEGEHLKPALSKVQQVGMASAVAMANEVSRLVGAGVAVTVELAPDSSALFYHVAAYDGSGELVRLKCSETPLDRLAQMAALIAKTPPATVEDDSLYADYTVTMHYKFDIGVSAQEVRAMVQSNNDWAMDNGSLCVVDRDNDRDDADVVGVFFDIKAD